MKYSSMYANIETLYEHSLQKEVFTFASIYSTYLAD